MALISPSVDTFLADLATTARSVPVTTTWTRAAGASTMTVVWPSGQVQSGAVGGHPNYYVITAISDPAVIAVNAVVTGTNTSATVVTLPCANAGATSGTITLNGADWVNANNTGRLTVDCHTVYGPNGAQQTLVTGLAGLVSIDSTKCRLIPYSGGSGTVPAGNTVISKGAASGKLVNVYASLNSAPILAGQAMPATGYILLRQWNSVSFTSGALSGITASATRSDLAGWLEFRCASTFGVGWTGIAGATVTQTQSFTGDWWTFLDATTSGVATTGYQIPTNGFTFYTPGIEVETSPGSGIYEFYGNASGIAATATNFSNDARCKLCWVSATGLVTFGYDGTNSGGGYLPPAGCKLRMQNLFIISVDVGNWIGTWTSSLASWSSGNTKQVTATKVMSLINGGPGGNTLICSDICQVMGGGVNPTNDTTIANYNIASVSSNNNSALSASGSNAKITFNNSTFLTYQSAACYVLSLSQIENWTFNDSKLMSLRFRSSTSGGAANLTNCKNIKFNRCVQNGKILQTACADISIVDPIYYDRPVGTTNNVNGTSVVEFANLCTNPTLDGFSLLVPQNAPYVNIWQIGSDSVTGFDIRNMGSPSNRVNLGGPETAVTWSRATTTLTVTFPSAHGINVGDQVIFRFISDTAVLTRFASITVSAVSGLTITIPCNNAGAATGTGTAFQVITGGLGAVQGRSHRMQRLYFTHGRTATGFLTTAANSTGPCRNVIAQSVWGDEWQATANNGGCFTYSKDSQLWQLIGDQTVYANPYLGTYWSGYYLYPISPANISGVSWSRVGTAITVVSAGHGIYTNTQVNVTATSSAGAMNLGVYTVTVTDANTFVFTGLNGGAANGTLTFQPINGRLAISAAISTVASAPYNIFTGNAGPSGTGRTITVVAGDSWTTIAPDKIIGYTSFAIAETSGINTTTNLLTYSVDDGNTFHNLSRPLFCSGTSGQYTITVPANSAIEVGDYVFSAANQIGYNAKVLAINGTTVTLDTPNAGTFTATLRFNHAPSEQVSASGFSLRVKFEVLSGSYGFQNVYIPMYANSAAMQTQYPLDPVDLTFSGLVVGSDVVIFEAGTTTVRAAVDSVTSSTWVYTYNDAGATIDIAIYKPGRKDVHIKNYVLPASATVLPITSQFVERAYI